MVEVYLHVFLTLAHDLGGWILFTLLSIHRKTLWYLLDGLPIFSAAAGIWTPDLAVHSLSLYCLLYPSSALHIYPIILILPSFVTKFPSCFSLCIVRSFYLTSVYSFASCRVESIEIRIFSHTGYSLWYLSSTSITCSSTYPAIFKPSRTWMRA
jgi:hypothetical protein